MNNNIEYFAKPYSCKNGWKKRGLFKGSKTDQENCTRCIPGYKLKDKKCIKIKWGCRIKPEILNFWTVPKFKESWSGLVNIDHLSDQQISKNLITDGWKKDRKLECSSITSEVECLKKKGPNLIAFKTKFTNKSWCNHIQIN